MTSTATIFFVFSPDRSQLLYASPTYETVWGRSLDSLYRDPASWLEAVHPDDRERVAIALKLSSDPISSENRSEAPDPSEPHPSIQTAQTSSDQEIAVTYRLVCGDRSIRWISVRSTLVIDKAGEPDRILECAEDITEREQAEQQLYRTNRALRTLSECNQTLVRAADETALLQDICQILVKVAGYRAAWIGFAEHDEAKSVRPVAQAGYSDEYLQSVQVSWAENNQGHSPTGTAICTQQRCIAQDILHNPTYQPWREAALRDGYASLMALPLMFHDSAFGALTLYSVRPSAFDAAEIRLLTELANDLAYGIVTLRTRKALHGSETKFREFLEAASEAIIVSNGKGEIVLFNTKAEELFGYSQTEMLDRPVECLMPERFRRGHVHSRGEYHEKPSRRSMGQSRNLSALRKDGTEFPIEAGLSSVNIDGELFTLTFLTDISDRQRIEAEQKRAEEALRQSEATLRQAEESLRQANQDLERRVSLRTVELSQLNDRLKHELTERERSQQRLQEQAQLLDLAHDTIMARRLDGSITFWNQGAEATYGWSRDEALGQISHTLLQTQFPQAQNEIEAELLRRGYWEGELLHTTQAGEHITVASRWALQRDRQGQPIKILEINNDITERKRSEEEQLRLAAIVESSDDGIIGISLDSAIMSWNSGAEKIYGFSADEILGQPIHRLVPPDLMAEESHIIEKIKQGDRLEHYETLRLHKDGTIFDVALTISPIKNSLGEVVGISKIARDISERKRGDIERQRAEEALAQELMRSKALFEASFDGIVVVNPRGNVVEANESFARMLGRSVPETLTLHVSDWDAQWTREELDEIVDSRQFVGQTFETLHRRRDGSVYEVEITISEVVLEEEILQVCICRDITARKQSEEQLRISTERTSLANAELARAARLKDEFLASMSHELRTPLNAILGLSEALIEEIFGSISEEQREHLSTIEQSGQHLLALINDILDLSKVESGMMELEITSVPVQEFCNSCLSFIKQQAHHKRIRLDSRIDEDLLEIEIDERRIRQVLVNLLSNAVKFTPDHGTVQLQMRADSFRETLEFSVTDTGIGIAPEHIGKLFQPFVQIDSALSRRYAGTGLGLALVRRITELHGGGVSLESQEGKGSRFTVTLPWAPSPTPDLVHEPEEVQARELAVEHVLIIEDSETAANQLVRYLSELGLKTLIHPRGDGALKMALQVQPDVIILDILLPDQSGWAVLESLKAHASTQAIPVIVVSVVEERLRSLTMGAVAHLLKPFTRQQLQQTLSRAMPVEEVLDGSTALVVAPTHTPLILLAEDNEANIAMLASYLKAQGLQVLLARNGSEAVEMARQHQPDLILMDIQMPEMDGFEATQNIRTESALAETPIIALTALAMPGDRDRCLAAGATDYLTKPISLKRLLHILSRYIPQLHLQGSVDSHEQ
ncbi:MAG: PAS domain S-box protein [Elainellaceae cyanobacterium]